MILFLKVSFIYFQFFYFYVLCKCRYCLCYNSFFKFCLFIYCMNIMFFLFYQCWREKEKERNKINIGICILRWKISKIFYRQFLGRLFSFSRNFFFLCLVFSVWFGYFIWGSFCFLVFEVIIFNSDLSVRVVTEVQFCFFKI